MLAVESGRSEVRYHMAEGASVYLRPRRCAVRGSWWTHPEEKREATNGLESKETPQPAVVSIENKRGAVSLFQCMQ